MNSIFCALNHIFRYIGSILALTTAWQICAYVHQGVGGPGLPFYPDHIHVDLLPMTPQNWGVLFCIPGAIIIREISAKMGRCCRPDPGNLFCIQGAIIPGRSNSDPLCILVFSCKPGIAPGLNPT
jgi:hypothetical protein